MLLFIEDHGQNEAVKRKTKDQMVQKHTLTYYQLMELWFDARHTQASKQVSEQSNGAPAPSPRTKDVAKIAVGVGVAVAT